MDWDAIPFPKILGERAEKFPDKVFLYFEDETFTYGELERLTNKIGNGLMNIGIKKSSHVGIMLQNCPEFLLSWFSLAKIGAVMVPFNPNLVGALLSYMVDDSDIETLITDKKGFESLSKVKGDLEPGKLKNIILIDSPSQEGDGDYTFYSFAEFLHFNDERHPNIDLSFDDILSILYTSGTTGPSKGVLLPHAYYFHVSDQFRKVRRLGPDDIVYTSLPWFHGAAQACHTYPTLLANGSIVVSREFDPDTFWQDIKKYNVTQVNYLSTMIYRLWNHPPSKYDGDHQPLVFFGVPTPWNIVEDFAKRFNVVRFIEGLGQTEAQYIGADYEKTTIDKLVRGSCGKVLEGFEVKIVDEKDRELPVGETGEIVVRPKYPSIIFAGYYKKPEATAEAMRNLWFHTGDRGYCDEEGNFYFVDRVKDVIRKSGENISSFELESIIMKYDKIEECASIPVKSETEDEILVAITLKRGVRPEEFNHLDFLRWCKEKMPYYMIPRYIRIVDALPKTPTHKVEKYKLRNEGITEDTWDRKKENIRIKAL